MEIEIRHAIPDDYHGIHLLFSQPKACSDTLQLPYSSPELWRKRLENVPNNSVSLVACVENEIVGSIVLFVIDRMRRRHVGTIGMGVHDAWQNQGVGTKLLDAVLDLADNWYNLIRVELTVFVDNEAAIHLYKQVGFQVEGMLKKYAFRNGEFVDSYGMGRIRTPDGCAPDA